MCSTEVASIVEQLSKTGLEKGNELSFAGRGLKLNSEDDGK